MHVPAQWVHPGGHGAQVCCIAAALQAGRRLLQGGPYRYELTAYCGGSPLQDRIDMVLTDASGNAIWQLQGKRERTTQQIILSVHGITNLMWERISHS